MGIDAEIFFRVKDGVTEPRLEDGIPEGFNVCPLGGLDKRSCLAPPNATHEVMCRGASRYYGPGYERGLWPLLAAVLMTILQSPDVETVWYGGDRYEEVPTFDASKLHQMNAYFLKYGREPYFGRMRR